MMGLCSALPKSLCGKGVGLGYPDNRVGFGASLNEEAGFGGYPDNRAALVVPLTSGWALALGFP